MRHYVKNKLIDGDWNFGTTIQESQDIYSYQFDLYLGKKGSRKEYLGPSVILALIECLEDKYWTTFFDNFFNSSFLIIRLFDKGFYGVGTIRIDRKRMSNWKRDKQMKRGNHEYQFTDKVACCKWFDQWSVTMLFSNISGIKSTSTVQRQRISYKNSSPLSRCY